MKLANVPVVTVVRGGEDTDIVFEEAFGILPETLFRNCEIVSVKMFEGELDGRLLYEATVELRLNDKPFSANVSETEPALYSMLGGTDSGLGSVRLNKDADSGSLGAVYEERGLWIYLSAQDMSENDFIDAIRTITGK